MIARVLSPVTVIVVAVLLGLLAGPAWYWTKASALAGQALAIRKALIAEEQGKVDQRKAHGWDFWTVEMENQAAEVKEEKALLKRKSEEMDQREERLQAESQDLDRVRADIEAMRKDIDDRAIAINADEKTNLKTLAKTYAALDATNAVAIIAEMDDSTAVKILYLMGPDAVSGIFNTMATTRLPDGSGTMARRAAMLSDRIRLMRSTPPPAPAGP